MRPIMFTIPKIGGLGPFPIHSFGVMIVLAFFAALWLVKRRAARYELDAEKIADLCFGVLIAGILGSRILFIVQELPYYLSHPKELFSLQFAGMTSFGELIFGVLPILWWTKKHKVEISRVLDLLAPAFVLGHVIGRFGCLLNGCCFGGVCPTGYPLGMKIPEDLTHLHYPAQIFDSAMNLVVLGILLKIESKSPRPWVIFSGFLILHGLTRFIYELWRAGTESQVKAGLASSTYWGSLPITQAQGVALFMMALGGIVLLRTKPRTAVTPTQEAL